MTRARIHINISFLLAVIALLSPSFLLSSCSSSDDGMNEPTPQDKQEIRFNPGIWNFMEGTRAATFDSQAAIRSEGSFACTAYTATTTDINSIVNINEAVNWNGASWAFSGGKRYWPAEALTLDFFAYMPVTIPDYITGPNYPTARLPQFSCSLPMTNVGQSSIKEFIYALAIGQTKATNGEGINLQFKHPFACIKFQLAANHDDITINSITLKGLKSGGTCSFDGSTSTWTSLTPNEGTTDFVMTLTGDAATFNNNPTTPQPIGLYAESLHQGLNLIMVPQDWTGAVEVNATWTVWGEEVAHTISTSVPTDWHSGSIYTYTFTITETNLKVDTSKYTEQW